MADRYDVTAHAKFGDGFRTPSAGTVEILYDVSVMDIVPVGAEVLVTYVAAEAVAEKAVKHQFTAFWYFSPLHSR